MPPTTSKTRRRPAAARKPAAKAKGQGGAVSLDDLSPADRKRLLAEAKGEDDHGQDQAEAEGRRRTRAIAQLMDVRDHTRKCPVAEVDEDTEIRVEMYPARRPPVTDKESGTVLEPAREVTTVRCIVCGGGMVLDEPYADAVARVDLILEESEDLEEVEA